MFILLLIAVSTVYVEAGWSYIRHTSSGLLLDASDEVVKLQHFAGSPAQRWEEQHIGQGVFYIRNQKNGKFLTIRSGLIEKADIITTNKEKSENQKWYINSDGTIVSSEGNLALDVSNNNAKAGQKVIAYSVHGQSNQVFLFQPQN